MKRPALRLFGQVLIWALGNSLAGAAVGLAVGFFREGGLELPVILISVLFGNVVGFTVLVSSVVLFPRLRTLAPVARFAFLGLALLSGAVAGTGIVLYLFPLFVLKDIPQAVAVAGINGVLALIVGTVAYVYEGLRSQLAESLREVEEVRLVEARLKEQAARAELAALQARINPHFFFNTLNTISSMLEDEPEKAGEMVQTLADLFRFTFKVADAGPVPLSEELRFIEGYLAIEQARFGDRLRVAWNVEDAARQVPVPGLILQPLVENAVLHGLAPLTAGGTVRISARLRESGVEIEVQDDGVGPGAEPDRLFREGHGLDNVRQRALAVYRGGGALRIERAASGKGTVARLILPAATARVRAEPGEESQA